MRRMVFAGGELSAFLLALLRTDEQAGGPSAPKCSRGHNGYPKITPSLDGIGSAPKQMGQSKAWT